jgi:prolycopene isomerase
VPEDEQYIVAWKGANAMKRKWDAVVIGAGLGGLAAAAALARAGKQPLVLEQSATPGGYAQVFRRGDFAFDISLHSMDGVAPSGWAYGPLRDLGVLERVEFTRLDPYYIARYPGREIIAHANPIAYETELISAFPDEAQGIRSLFDELIAVFRETHRLRIDHEIGADSRLDQTLLYYPHLVQATKESWAEFMARHIQNPELKAVISAQWSYFGLPPSRLNSATFAMLWASAHQTGAFYPRGGSGAVSRALEAIIKEHGGEIRYQQRVTRIHIEDGVAVGVSTADGAKEAADVVISNANAPDTLLNMIDPQQLPAGYTNRVEVTPHSLSSFNIYLGLDLDLRATGLPHELFISEDFDPEAQYQAILAGDWERVPYLLVHYSGTEPDSAPAGCSSVVLMCLAPWNYRNVWGTGGDLSAYQQNAEYLQIKEAVAATLLARAEAHIPGLREAIHCKEIATPLTNVRYTLNRSGSLFGFEQSVEGMYLLRLDDETPIPNLFLCGAWTNPGGGQSAAMLSGQDVVRHAIKYLKAASGDAPVAPVKAPPVVKAQAQPDAIPVGRPAPAFRLAAVGSEREVSLQACGKRPLVLMFHTQETADAASEINMAIRAQFPLATQVSVANIIDLGNVPGMFHKLIDMMLKRVYKQAVGSVSSGFDPADYIMIAPDWTGQVTRLFGVHNANKAVAVVVIDRLGNVQGAYQGGDVTDTILSLLKWM